MVTKSVGSSCKKTSSELNFNDLCNVDLSLTPDLGNIVIGNGTEFTTLDSASISARTEFVNDLVTLLNNESVLNNTTFSCSIIDWDNCPAGTIPISAINGTFTGGGTVTSDAISYVNDSIPTTAIDWSTITPAQSTEILNNSGTTFDGQLGQNISTGQITLTAPSGALTTVQTTSTDVNNLLGTGSDGGSLMIEPDSKLP